MSDLVEPRDPPIEPQEFLGGVKVVDIGDLRVARGLSRRAFSGCHHRQLRYDKQERRIWCADCETTIEGFDAFEQLVSRYDMALKDLSHRREAVETAEKSGLISLAARALDKVWRSRRMVPACPCCGQGLFPEDFKNGAKSILGREFAEAKRKKSSSEKGG